METMTVSIIFSVSVLLILSALTEIISKYSKLPFSILLVVVGFLVSMLGRMGPEVFHPLANFKIHPDIILYACLPTLIFESAYAMDSRIFKRNMAPILMLAIPGLFLSTFIIGVMVNYFTSLDFLTSLLLGAILSATDPVAVISLFKQLGVPKRLNILVEGESLLNDSTAIVTAKTILFIMAAGTVTSHTYLHGAMEFFIEFFGGILVGYLITIMAGYFIRIFEDAPITQLSLTVILAYLSFLLADDVFKVSGVMATITAGIVMSGVWGKTKLSAEADAYIKNLLELLAYIANALIFLLVGFTIHYAMEKSSLDILFIVIIAMLVSRAVIVYGLLPIIGKLRNAEQISWRYKTIMWWGGLRGAIALAIVFGLSDLPDQEVLISVVMGAVIFTILVQGISINKLISWLKLDKPTLSDRVAQLEAELSADKSTLRRLPDLQRGGLFSLTIVEDIRRFCEKELKVKHLELEALKQDELDMKGEKKLLYISCFAAEKQLFYQLFTDRHFSERVYYILSHDIDLEIDMMRYHSRISKNITFTPYKKIWNYLYSKLSHIAMIRPLMNYLKLSGAVSYYEEQWGLHQGCIAVLNHLDEIAEIESISSSVVQEVRQRYKEWLNTTRGYLDTMAEQFPEFVTDMQHRLAKRIFIHSKITAIEKQKREGLLPEGIADQVMHEYLVQIRNLRKISAKELQITPKELLLKIPFLADIPAKEADEIIKLLKERRLNAGEVVIKEGETEDEMYFILRGVVRVIKNVNGVDVDVATLLAGDFFGEIALLSGVKRTATCRAVTPCIVYSLSSQDFNVVRQQFPVVDKAISAEAERRKKT